VGKKKATTKKVAVKVAEREPEPDLETEPWAEPAPKPEVEEEPAKKEAPAPEAPQYSAWQLRHMKTRR
jgi:hypothetical protein